MRLIVTAALVLAVSVCAISGWKWDRLSVRYSMIVGGYWRMPVTVSDIKKEDPPTFVKAGHDGDLNVDLYSYPDDPRFFLLFDSHGNIAGVRTGYIKADLDREAKIHGLGFPYNYARISMFKSANIWHQDIWYSSILFVNPDKLKKGGRKNTDGIVAEGVYVYLDNDWVNVPRNECNAEALGFTRNGCFIGMGQHYFYKADRALDCKNFQPFFALYDGGELIGFGLVPFGSFTNKEGGVKLFENTPRKAVEYILPNGPECAFQWVDDYGVSSLHFFLKKHARWTMCPLWNSDRCKT